MKKIIALCALLGVTGLPAVTAVAQETAPPAGDLDQGIGLLQDGAKLLLRGLMSEVEPKMDEMGRALDGLGAEMGAALDQMPAFVAGVMALVDDIGNYSAPEKLPNGDIILRRKVVLPPEAQGPEIEL